MYKTFSGSKVIISYLTFLVCTVSWESLVFPVEKTFSLVSKRYLFFSPHFFGSDFFSVPPLMRYPVNHGKIQQLLMPLLSLTLKQSLKWLTQAFFESQHLRIDSTCKDISFGVHNENC